MPMTKATKEALDAELEEVEQRDVTLTLGGNLLLDEAIERLHRLRARTSKGGKATRLRIRNVPGDGNGTPERFRFTASYGGDAGSDG